MQSSSSFLFNFYILFSPFSLFRKRLLTVILSILGSFCVKLVESVINFLISNVQNFKHIMKELQGAIIIGSAFQAILGYSGLMTILLKYEFLPYCVLLKKTYPLSLLLQVEVSVLI